jgi:predicted nucleotidyltransferase component of viral defense system
MIEFNLGKYINYVKNKLDVSIEDHYIEKDYLLSLFLSTWQKLWEQGEITSLNDLIFKGGTLLMRNHLAYSRISEDLDFTHKKCEEIHKMSQNKRINTIRRLIIPILRDIKKICDHAEFDFEIKRDNKTYVTAYHHKAVYSMSIYRISEITNLPIRIKIEINFVEHLQYPAVMQTIIPIVDNDTVLTSIGYNLVPIGLFCYALEEIVLEKYRAILTRDAPMQRDIYDLYLIDKKEMDVLDIDKNKIFKKIESGRLATSHLDKNLSNNCKYLLEKGFLDSEDDITLLSLLPINNVQYERFKKKLFKRLQYLCETRK